MGKYKYTIVAFSYAFGLLVLVSSIFYATMPTNPVSIKSNYLEKAITLIPQGWAFFTRDPREAQVLIYEIGKNNALTNLEQKHSSYKNLFGLSRKSSKIMIELQLIKNKLSDSLYQNTKWNYQDNFYTTIPDKS